MNLHRRSTPTSQNIPLNCWTPDVHAHSLLSCTSANLQLTDRPQFVLFKATTDNPFKFEQLLRHSWHGSFNALLHLYCNLVMLLFLDVVNVSERLLIISVITQAEKVFPSRLLFKPLWNLQSSVRICDLFMIYPSTPNTRPAPSPPPRVLSGTANKWEDHTAGRGHTGLNTAIFISAICTETLSKLLNSFWLCPSSKGPFQSRNFTEKVRQGGYSRRISDLTYSQRTASLIIDTKMVVQNK